MTREAGSPAARAATTWLARARHWLLVAGNLAFHYYTDEPGVLYEAPR